MLKHTKMCYTIVCFQLQGNSLEKNHLHEYDGQISTNVLAYCIVYLRIILPYVYLT